MSSVGLEFEELDDWLWCLRTAVVSCYALRDRDEIVMVDANIAGQHDAILAALANRLGVSPEAVPVREILLTHAHGDHYGSAQAIASRTGAVLLGPAEEASIFSGADAMPPPRLLDWERPLFDQAMASVPPPDRAELDRRLVPGDPLGWEIGAELVAAPGHTPGQIAVWMPERRTLIAADALAIHEQRPIVGVFNVDADRAARTARELLDRDPRRLCVGHGMTLTGDVRGAFASTT